MTVRELAKRGSLLESDQLIQARLVGAALCPFFGHESDYMSFVPLSPEGTIERSFALSENADINYNRSLHTQGWAGGDTRSVIHTDGRVLR